MRRQILLSMGWTVLVLAMAVSAANAEDRTGMVGLSASIQESQLDIMLPIWASPRVVVTPSVSVIRVSDVVSDFGAGLMIRVNVQTGDAVPYLGARFGMLRRSPENIDATTDYYYGPAGGGEYFLSEHFSLGVEAQLNITKSDDNSTRFGNPGGTNINTATAVLATFYF